MFSVLDLFSGIGGFSLGLERTGGFQTVAFCEIDPFCQKVLKKHWPSVPIYNDIKNLTKEKLYANGIVPDVLTGGFPCQDLSTAGKQHGISGERSSLWAEYARLISELQPRYALVENVPGLLSGERGAWFGRLLGDLAEIGYDAEWHCISAENVGAPHRRNRVWIIAYPHEFRSVEVEIFKFANIKQYSTWASTTIKRDVGIAGNSKMQFPAHLFVDDGLPLDMDTIKVCGNSVIPQIIELIGDAILRTENQIL